MNNNPICGCGSRRELILGIPPCHNTKPNLPLIFSRALLELQEMYACPNSKCEEMEIYKDRRLQEVFDWLMDGKTDSETPWIQDENNVFVRWRND